LTTWNYIPPVTQVVEPAKFAFELTEEEARGLHLLIRDGLGAGSRSRLHLSGLLRALQEAGHNQGWFTDGQPRPEFSGRAGLKSGPFRSPIRHDNPFEEDPR
jgi:hypothetical protein